MAIYQIKLKIVILAFITHMILFYKPQHVLLMSLFINTSSFKGRWQLTGNIYSESPAPCHIWSHQLDTPTLKMVHSRQQYVVLMYTRFSTVMICCNDIWYIGISFDFISIFRHFMASLTILCLATIWLIIRGKCVNSSLFDHVLCYIRPERQWYSVNSDDFSEDFLSNTDLQDYWYFQL